MNINWYIDHPVLNLLELLWNHLSGSGCLVSHLFLTWNLSYSATLSFICAYSTNMSYSGVRQNTQCTACNNQVYPGIKNWDKVLKLLAQFPFSWSLLDVQLFEHTVHLRIDRVFESFKICVRRSKFASTGQVSHNFCGICTVEVLLYASVFFRSVPQSLQAKYKYLHEYESRRWCLINRLPPDLLRLFQSSMSLMASWVCAWSVKCTRCTSGGGGNNPLFQYDFFSMTSCSIQALSLTSPYYAQYCNWFLIESSLSI
jgi:hypothetical protein